MKVDKATRDIKRESARLLVEHEAQLVATAIFWPEGAVLDCSYAVSEEQRVVIMREMALAVARALARLNGKEPK